MASLVSLISCRSSHFDCYFRSTGAVFEFTCLERRLNEMQEG